MDKVVFKKTADKRAFVTGGKLGFAVTRAKKFKFLFFQSLGVSLALDVIGIRNKFP